MQARSLRLFLGVLVLRERLGSQNSSMSLGLKWDGFWGQLDAVTCERSTKWLGCAFIECRPFPYLQETQETSPRDCKVGVISQSPNWFSYLLSSGSEGIPRTERQLYLWSYPGTLVQASHLMQPCKNLINEVIHIPTLPDERAEMGRCWPQSYATSDSKAPGPDPQMAFCQRCVVGFLRDQVTFL